MGLMRARGVALVLAAAAAVSLTSVVPAVASSGRADAPTVSYRQTAADTVEISGRTATRSPKVRIDRRTSSGWSRVKTVRAHRHRYLTTLSVAAGSTVKFRVTSDRRSSTFRVSVPASTKTTQPTTRPPSDACGVRPRKADGSFWACSFDEEFSGTTLDRTKWIPQTVFSTGSAGAYACYRDDPANVNVANGVLNLNLVKLDAPAPCGTSTLAPTPYQSGMVSTWHLFSQQYGRFEARMRTTASSVPGLHEAFWLWPDDRVPSTAIWPTAGEIDVAETYSAHPDLAIPFLHYAADAGGPQPGVNTAWNCTAARGVWNTYTLEWGPGRLAIYVNGQTCLVNTSGDPAFQKPYIVAFTQGLGDVGNTLVAGTPVPASTQVDYLHVWR